MRVILQGKVEYATGRGAIGAALLNGSRRHAFPNNVAARERFDSLLAAVQFQSEAAISVVPEDCIMQLSKYETRAFSRRLVEIRLLSTLNGGPADYCSTASHGPPRSRASSV